MAFGFYVLVWRYDPFFLLYTCELTARSATGVCSGGTNDVFYDLNAPVCSVTKIEFMGS